LNPSQAPLPRRQQTRQRRSCPPSPWRLADELAAMGHGLIMVMGKGGVGKTTIAAALAVGLVQRGHSVHLTTTDPAAHVSQTLNGSLPGLKSDRIDPVAETQAYIDKIMATRGKRLDARAAPCCWKTCSRPAPKRWPCSTPSAAW
jgi:arsenite-transporting ATPase